MDDEVVLVEEEVVLEDVVKLVLEEVVVEVLVEVVLTVLEDVVVVLMEDVVVELLDEDVVAAALTAASIPLAEPPPRLVFDNRKQSPAS